MLIRIIEENQCLVAICDSNLVGKKFEEGEFQLDLTSDFFKGKDIPEKQIIEIMKRMWEKDATFNIVGKKSIKTALKANIISKEAIKKIKGIPFTLILF